ncbi:hypothetical protein FGO68_gene11959 [Halteria grandinella]|uniref:4-nitrophenylphosphatase n=1 Tax=Halteria grandinella TaxID=5974 RepID=A0A8J8NL21_HALGN|nr:hypothetical protein FGO68_gene11959 [Halteria grandinella]
MESAPFADLVTLIDQYDYFLFDCDGVFWHGDSEIEKGFSALRHLQSIPGKHIYLITNNSSRLRETVIKEKLKPLGGEDFEVPLDQIYTSAYITGQYIRENLIKDDAEASIKKVYVVGQQGLKDELKKAGIQVINDHTNGWAPSSDPSMSIEEFSSMEVDPNVVAVVAGIYHDFNYRTLCIASLYLQLNNATFLATNNDRVFPTHVPDRKCPAGGSIVAAIASQCPDHQKPQFMGKPNPQIFDIIKREHPHLKDAPLSKFLMVGDNLQTDIKFGNNCGIDTLVVLSGNASLKQALAAQLSDDKDSENGKPTHIIPYFSYSQTLKFD